MANPKASKSITADEDNNPLLSTQQSLVADAAAATAAAAALTGAAVGDTVSTTAGWGSSTEAGFDSMHVAIDANVVDIAAQKVELDKLITDVGLIRAALNDALDVLEEHGLMADA